MMTFGEFTVPAPYTEGTPVDASGVTPEGDALAGIDEYKRHLASQLLVHATGTEIEFADRDSVKHILAELGDRGYPARAIIQEVVTSDLFRRQ